MEFIKRKKHINVYEQLSQDLHYKWKYSHWIHLLNELKRSTHDSRELERNPILDPGNWDFEDLRWILHLLI